MKFRQFLVVALSAALLSSALVSLPQAASAAGSCSPVTPSKVWVDRPYLEVPVSLGSNCYYAGVDYASWNVVHRYYGPQDIVIMDGSDSDTWTFYDWDYLGGYDITPSNCWDADYNDISQGSAFTNVKLGSRVSVKAVRNGNYVTLTATGQRYIPDREGFGAWRGGKVSFESQVRGGSWGYVKWLYLDASGHASTRVYAPNARYWHAKLNDSSNTWGRTSATVSR